MDRHASLLFACSLTISACAGASPPQETAASPPRTEAPAQSPAMASAAGASQPAAPASTKTRGEAHRVAIATVACWLGGVWSDAEGVADEADRAVTSDRRCHDLVRRIYGTDDAVHYERLRALESVEVSEITARIQAIARTDEVDAARERQIGTMLQGVADVEREMMLARRAGDKVKLDVNAERPRTKLTADEQAAVGPLRDGKAFDALLNLDAGDLTHEARAIAILVAADRMKTANGLPKHLKIFAVEQPYASLFRVPAPQVSSDATPLKGGVWLTYLTTVAKAAGHPVPAKAESLRDQELLAWSGTLAGLADKLRVESDQVSDATDMKRILGAIVLRIDAEHHASEDAIGKVGEAAAPPEKAKVNAKTTANKE